MIEYGIEWRFKGDTSPGHTSGGYTLAGARSQVANSGDPKRFHPYAARVMERDVSDWRDAETPCAVGDSPSVTPAEKDQSCDNERGGQRVTSPASTPLRPGRSAS